MEKVIKQVNKYMQLYKNPPPVNLYSPDTKPRFFQQFIFVLGAWSNFSFQVEEIVGRKCSITLYQEKIILEEVNFLYCKIYPFPLSLSLLLNFPSFLFFFSFYIPRDSLIPSVEIMFGHRERIQSWPSE